MLAGMGGVSYHRLVAAVSEAGGIGYLRRVDDGGRRAARARSPRCKRAHRQAVRRRPPHRPARARSRPASSRVIDGGARIFVAGLGVPREVIDLLHSKNVLVGSHVRQGAPRDRRGGERLRLRRRPGHRGRRPHRHGRHDGARPAGRRRGRRPGARRRRRRAVRRARAWPPRSRSAPTACGSAPASSPRPRRAPSTATRRRCWRRPEDGTVVSRAYSGKTCRVVRNDWTQHFDEHPDELQPFPQQLGVSYKGGANHLGSPEGTEVDVGKEFMPAGQGVGRHRRPRPRRRHRARHGEGGAGGDRSRGRGADRTMSERSERMARAAESGKR